MNPKDKKFQDALVRININKKFKQKDNNDYKACKKKCEKILEKNGKNKKKWD